MIDRTTHNYTLVIVILDKTIREVCLIYVAITKPQPSQYCHREAPEVQRFEGRAYNNLATENGVYNSTSAVLPTTGIIPNKLHESLKLLNLHPALYILMLEPVILNKDHTVRTFLVEQ